MTTIVYADGILAYESRVTMNGMIVSDEKEKLKRIGGYGFIFIGPICDHQRLAAVYLKPDTITDEDKQHNEAEAIIFGDGILEEVSIHKTCGLIRTLLGDFSDAWGSGAAYAIAGLRMGMNAHDAVELAIKCDSSSGGIIRTIEVKE